MPVITQTTVRLEDRPGDYLTVERREASDDYPDEVWRVVYGDGGNSVYATADELVEFAAAVLALVDNSE